MGNVFVNKMRHLASDNGMPMNLAFTMTITFEMLLYDSRFQLSFKS